MNGDPRYPHIAEVIIDHIDGDQLHYRGVCLCGWTTFTSTGRNLVLVLINHHLGDNARICDGWTFIEEAA